MIAYVKGVLDEVLEQSVVVDVHGVGYLVHISSSTLAHLPSRGAEVKLFTYMQVKEDGQALHGFLTREELRLFSLLISVSGVGPKAAGAILSVLSPTQLIIAIVAEDAVALSRAPGVGRKTAQRILLELRDKMKSAAANWDHGIDLPVDAFGGNVGASGPKQDAIDALLALGYGRSEAMQAVLEAAEDGQSAEEIIRQALKKLSRR